MASRGNIWRLPYIGYLVKYFIVKTSQKIEIRLWIAAKNDRKEEDKRCSYISLKESTHKWKKNLEKNSTYSVNVINCNSYFNYYDFYKQ